MTGGTGDVRVPQRPHRVAALASLVSVLVALFAWAEIFALTHRLAESRARYVDANVFNGDFQTFDPIRRLFAGEVLFRDFDVYLGIGPTLATALATWVCGGDFRASLYAVMFLCVSLHGFVVFLAGRLCGLGWGLASLVALALVQLVLLKTSPCLPLWFVEWHRSVVLDVAQPAGSILGIRSALAPLMVSLLALTWRWWQASGQHADRRRVIVTGVCAGCGFLWSNDSGLPFAAAILGTLAVVWLRDRRPVAVVRNLALAVIVTGFTSLVLLTVVTGGTPQEWFRFNFLGVARDQFWYYVGDKVLVWHDIPVGRENIAAVVCLAWIAVRQYRRAEATRASLLIPLLGSVFLTGVLSQVGGAIQTRYGRPIERLLLIVLPFVVADICRVVWQTVVHRRSASPAGAEPSLATDSSNRSPSILGLLVRTTAACGLALIWWSTRPDWQAAFDKRPVHTPGNYFVWDRPQGAYSNYYAKTISVGETLFQEFSRDAVPPRERVFSTYVSYLDLTTESFNPSRHDQIIHALGPDRRTRYQTALESSNTRYAATPRRDRFVFEPWLRCVNWPVYEHLLRHFDPVFTTDDSVVWRRRGIRRDWLGKPGPVDVTRHGSACYELRFDIPADDQERLRDKALVLIEFDYETARVPGAGFQGLLRQHLIAQDISVPFRYRDPCLNWGLPVGRGHAAFAVDGTRHSANVIFLNLDPAPLSRLEIRNVTRTVLVPLELIDDFPEESLWATSWTDGGTVKSGIMGNSIILQQPRDSRHLRSGDELEFSGSGRRRIVAVDKNRIDVDGPPLDPARDGFPHPVRVLNPQWRGAPLPPAP